MRRIAEDARATGTRLAAEPDHPLARYWSERSGDRPWLMMCATVQHLVGRPPTEAECEEWETAAREAFEAALPVT